MRTVKTLGIDAVQLAYSAREIVLGRFAHQIRVIDHQAVGVTSLVHALPDGIKYSNEGATGCVIQEDIGLAIAYQRSSTCQELRPDPKEGRRTAEGTGRKRLLKC